MIAATNAVIASRPLGRRSNPEQLSHRLGLLRVARATLAMTLDYIDSLSLRTPHLTSPQGGRCVKRVKSVTTGASHAR